LPVERTDSVRAEGASYQSISFWTAFFCCWAVLITAISFAPAIKNEFVDWDDTQLIVENVHLRKLGWDQIRWMFTSFRMGPYQPLPWLSLALDYRLAGFNPALYHLTNVLWHGATVVGFFAIARRLIGAVWVRGAEPAWRLDLAASIASVLFAVHPLRVESVVWISERRDVLSGFFMVTAVWAYLRAVQPPRLGVSLGWLVVAYFLFAASLASKATGMCLPAVLSILDVYPLGRLRDWPSLFRNRSARWIWAEKIPFWLLSVAAGAAAVYGQRQAGAVVSLEAYGLTHRIALAGYASIFYVGKTLFPVWLSPLYEIPTDFRPGDLRFVASCVAVLAVTGFAIWMGKRWPAFLVAWLSYLILLAPVSGLAQTGGQLAADRYTYLPCMSFAILLGGVVLRWSQDSAFLKSKSFSPGSAMWVVLLAISMVFAPLTWRQTRVWQNTLTLWRHALDVNPMSSVACNNVAKALSRQQKLPEAYRMLEKALRLRPNNVDAHNNIAVVMRRMGQPVAAMQHYLEAERGRPHSAEIQYNIGVLLAEETHFDQLGFSQIESQWEAGFGRFQRAIELNPDHVKARNDLGILCKKMGRLDEAIRYYQSALALDPELIATHYNLANARASAGQVDEAIATYRWILGKERGHLESSVNLSQLLERRGDYKASAEVLRNALEHRVDNDLLLYRLSWLLATAPDPAARNGREAAALAQRLCRRSNGADPRAVDVLAAALAEVGQFAEAREQAERAAGLAAGGGQAELSEQIRARAAMYESGVPFRSEAH
jgi:tetratricopeptide (TPR) repeat protein